MIESFEKLSEEKRETILNICMDSFIQNGYTLANTVDIAKACGIAKGSLFHYFGNKKSLFLYIVKLSIERVMDETRAALSQINDKGYFDRVRKSAAIKMALPMKYPKETNLLTRAFSEWGHEASDTLRSLALEYTAQMRTLSTLHIGEIEPELIKEDIDLYDAKLFIQTVFDGITSRLMQQYAKSPKTLLDNPGILTKELEKATNLILKGIGK